MGALVFCFDLAVPGLEPLQQFLSRVEPSIHNRGLSVAVTLDCNVSIASGLVLLCLQGVAIGWAELWTIDFGGEGFEVSVDGEGTASGLCQF